MVLLLDAYHLGDPLFVTGLARDLATRQGRGAVLVHGSAERGERALEALGLAPTSAGGVWATSDDEQAGAVERATRALSREIVHELNEAGVSAVRALGADRGLLKTAGGGVEAGETGWLETLVAQGVVAVVASLVAPEARASNAAPLVEADPAAAAAALAAKLGGPVAVLLKKSLPDARGPISMSDADVRSALGDSEGAGRLVEIGAPTLAVGRGALRDPGALRGARLGT